MLSANISQSVSVNNSDDAPFLEMLRNVQTNVQDIDILLVTPGGSAETVAFWVNKYDPDFLMFPLSFPIWL